jgi:hypothetical protein
MARKQVDPKAKAKRQKIILAVGGVLLLAVLAFQVPRTMKMLHPKTMDNSSPAPTSTAPVSSTGAPLAPPSLDGGAAAGGGSSASGAGGSADGLADPGGGVTAGAGQLVTFDRFRSKDPFSQQLGQCGSSDCTTGSPKPATQPAAGSTGSSGGGTPSTTTTTPGSGSGSGSSSGTSGGASAATTATISVDGVAEQVGIGKNFPASDPVFVLVAVSAKSAKIGIAGGSYENGSSTITLQKGKSLTLVNTADGTRYVLKLLATA